MRRISVLWCLWLVLAISGCARTVAVSEVREDGSWKRSVTFTVSQQEGMGPETKIEDVFALPSGAQWKTSREKGKGELIFRAEREAKLGETIEGDVTILEKKQPKLVSRVTVSEIEPGVYEYREVYRLATPRKPLDAVKLTPEERQKLPALLRDNATDDQLKEIMTGTVDSIWRLLFGPSEPLLLSFLVQPEVVERKMRQRMGAAMEAELEKVLGEKLDATQRRAIVRELLTESQLKSAFNPEEEAKKKTEEEPSTGSGAGLVSILVSVKLPGTIVESNGLVDPYTGEVFWNFYQEAAEIRDVELRAVARVK